MLAASATAVVLSLLAAVTGSHVFAEPQPTPQAVVVDPAKLAQGQELFKSHVRNLLIQHCLKCHGGEMVKGGFDLATREGLMHGGSDGAAITPGKAQASRLYRLISHAEEPHMPLKAAKLPDDAIARIAAWIDLGAPYDKPLVEKSRIPRGRPTVSDEDRKFWSFQPLAHAPIPQVKNAAWCRTAIDHFIVARLEEKGLTANPPIERRKLIRRAYFDLTGLPPTPDEVEAFVNDSAADAYEKLIDRLLLSPHYGERWGRHWLDLARFAESHGYEQDYDRPTAYHYRDFVIQALNQDMPYDRFVKLQIAGDELEPENPLALMATGYLAAGTHATQITANQVEKERYDELDDMAATIGTSLLGITIGCARCHDHKFDPIPQQDYYRLVSTFTTTVRSDMELDLHPEAFRQAKAEFDRRHAPLTEALARFEKEQLPGRLEQWLKGDPKVSVPQWLVLEPVSFVSEGGATLTRQDDGSYLASGTNAASDTYTFVAHTPLTGITAIRLEALADASLVKMGPGRAANGNFALSDFRLTVAPQDKTSPPIPVKLINPAATFEQAGLPIAAALDDNKTSGWAVDPQFGKNHAARFELAAPVGFEGGSVLTFTLKFETNTGHSIGRPRLSVSTAPAPVAFDAEHGPASLAVVHKVLLTPAAQRTETQNAALLQWYRTTDAELRALNQPVQEHLKQLPKPQLTKVLVSSEGVPAIRLHTQGGDFFEKTFFLKRGDLNQKQGEATPGFLQVLMPAAGQETRWQETPPAGWRTSYRRRSLANWLTDPKAGAGQLLARVIVNRLWQHHLGRGIVATPSDFGAQGEAPTHPELLDWLAAELIQQGWRLKAIHKLILMSAVYMQGDGFDAARNAIDPHNLLLWRRSPKRLEGEAIRDAMLAVSGMLDETMFGPGSLDEGHRRRSVYFTIKRSQLIPILMLFDAPDSLQSMGSRSSTTIAPQALAMMNNVHIQRYARTFGARLLSKPMESPAAAVQAGYRMALGRPPGDDELADTVTFIQQQSESYRAAGKPNPLELALGDFCQALMCLNEFVFVE